MYTSCNSVNCAHRHEQTVDDMKQELAVISSVSFASNTQIINHLHMSRVFLLLVMCLPLPSSLPPSLSL